MFDLTTKEIQVTEEARDYLATQCAQQGKQGVRLSIRAGRGCGGSEYDVSFADAPGPGEEILRVDETLAIYIPAADVLKLFGARVDYRVDDVGNRRMIIDNPNEKGRCGCGESVVF